MNKRKFSPDSSGGPFDTSNTDIITGYVTNVSPIKLARNEKTRYFTADMQVSKTETQRVICFSQEKHHMFKTAETSPDPFMLKKAKVQPGKDGKMEIKFFRECEIQHTKKRLDFTKDYQSYVQAEEASDVTISQLDNDYQMGSINVKFLGFEEEGKTVFTKYGQRTVSIGVIADSSQARKLTVWSPELCKKLCKGDFFRLSSIQNKLFDNEMNINTTSSTTITNIPPFQGIKEDLACMKQVEMLNCTFESVSVHGIRRCSVCKQTVTMPDEKAKILKCTSCNYKQLVGNLETSVSISGYVKNDDGKKKVIVQDNVLKTFLSSQNKLDIITDNDALEDFILLNSPYEITFNSKGEIVSNILKL